MQKTFRSSELNLEVQIGKYARLADGAVFLRSGNTVVLSTAVESESESFLGFLPLSVEFRERMSAAGKIPGGYIKREGKLSDAEVLSSRLIDRTIRPLFPTGYFNELQVLSTVYSSDGQIPANILGIIGSSLALFISKIPFLGPVGAVQLTFVNGEWKINGPSLGKTESSCTIIVAGTQNGVCMVEGHCNNLPEKDIVDVLFLAHEEIKKQVAWQISIAKELGIDVDALVVERQRPLTDFSTIKAVISEALGTNCMDGLFVPTKKERETALQELKKNVAAATVSLVEQGTVTASVVDFVFDTIIKEQLPDLIVKKAQRVDLRALDQVRPIFSETALLPCVHGSAVFQRGETQALASVTLGTGADAQKVESLSGLTERSFMLHYNFLPFCTGEVKQMRGTSRRETGHGYLAETSFLNVLPSQEEFPYTIRSVVDVLESNGSSSMASVCSTSLALMDAGIPIKQVVGGVAMGLIKDSAGNFHVLTDILGMEDALGLMDFKVTGTETGVMAFQMDIKDKVGLSRELFIHALEQARKGRLHIISEMKKVLAAPRAELSILAPRVLSFKVEQDKIGAIIGPAGKNIKEVTAKTDTQIDISDDGLVRIYSKDKESAESASVWVKLLAGDVEVGKSFSGIIRRFAEFGIFVELVPGRDGLVHISTIAKHLQKDLEKNYKVNDKLVVKIIAYDKESNRIRLSAPELEKK